MSQLVAQTLDVRADDGAPMLFSDHPDPGVANYAVIFHYYSNRDGGNAFQLNIGAYRRDPEGWRYLGMLDLFGLEPRDGRFDGARFFVTTTTLGPNEPRCCPTQVSKWTADLNSLQVQQL